MAFTYSALEGAVTHWLGSVVVSVSLPTAARRVLGVTPSPATPLTYLEAAEVLLSALLAGSEPPTLHSVTISTAAGRTTTLNAGMATEHPATKEWASPSPAGFIACHLRRGALLIGEGENVPNSALQVIDWRGLAYAVVNGAEAGLGYCAEYGPAPDGDALQSIQMIHTETLRTIGYHAGSQTILSEPADQADIEPTVDSKAIH